MAPRPSWKGYLKLSLVSCPVALYPCLEQQRKDHVPHAERRRPAIGSSSNISMPRPAISSSATSGSKATRSPRGDYLILTDDELADVKIESSHTIDIERFVPKTEIDALYFDNNYYLTPDDKGRRGGLRRDPRGDEQARHGRCRPGRAVRQGADDHAGNRARRASSAPPCVMPTRCVREGAYFDEIPKVDISKELLDPRLAYYRHQGGESSSLRRSRTATRTRWSI